MIGLDLKSPYADAVLLADGNVFLIGGGQGDPNSTAKAKYGCPIFDPEIFNVASEQWEPVAPHVYPRMYHSVAVLLADGSVWTAGQNVDSKCTMPPPCENGCDPTTRTWPEGGKIVEIYHPWYFDETRPVITSAPPPDPDLAVLRGGDNFFIGYEVGPGRSMDPLNGAKVALISLSSVTHSVNMSQRYLIIDHDLDDPEPDEWLEVTPPPVEYAPPGPYMIVIIDDLGVPSEAKFLYLK